jgi:L-histidine N-alpha-methyltransferase
LSAGTNGRLTVDVHLADGGHLATIGQDVREGLLGFPKTLPSKYFYDERGSALFEQITELPEYYQTRTESSILALQAAPLTADYGFSELVELGSGSARKTRILLDALRQRGSLERFVPLDVSEEMLRQSSRALLQVYPEVQIHGVVGDFLGHLRHVPAPRGRRLVVFLGGTIGNLDVGERAEFLTEVRSLIGSGDRFLIGLDLVKDVERLEAAYNDAAGITAEFNLNVLRVVNRALEANFDPGAFWHSAFYAPAHARIEMHLVSDFAQSVEVRSIGLSADLDAGESIRTEISCKFTRDTAERMLASAGFSVDEWLVDQDNLFALVLAGPAT